MDFSDATVLDLFAGFGTLGFEALSRGAATVCFVDSGTKSVRALEASAEELGVSSRTRIVRRDAVQFVRSETDCYDLVFCDPPYNWRDYENLVREITGKGLLSREGVLLVEHSRRYNFERHELYAFHKDYGNTRVTFFAHRDSGKDV